MDVLFFFPEQDGFFYAVTGGVFCAEMMDGHMHLLLIEVIHSCGWYGRRRVFPLFGDQPSHTVTGKPVSEG